MKLSLLWKVFNHSKLGATCTKVVIDICYKYRKWKILINKKQKITIKYPAFFNQNSCPAFCPILRKSIQDYDLIKLLYDR